MYDPNHLNENHVFLCLCYNALFRDPTPCHCVFLNSHIREFVSGYYLLWEIKKYEVEVVSIGIIFITDKEKDPLCLAKEDVKNILLSCSEN